MSKTDCFKGISIKTEAEQELVKVEPVEEEEEDSLVLDIKEDPDASDDESEKQPISNSSENELKPTETFSCDFCYKTYLHKSALGKHLQSHAAKLSSRKKVSSRLVGYKILRNHKGEKEKLVSSDHCRETFSKISPSPFENSRLFCALCPKSFGNRADLTWHTRTHCDTTFHCEHCSMGFSSKAELLKHIRVHSGKKPWLYFCEHCHKGFPDKSSLIEHKRTHTPYSIGEKSRAPKSLPKPHLVTQMRMRLKQLFHTT